MTKLPKASLLAIVSITIFFLITHLWNLTSLPVFADEAIYIRWTQLIIDDWQRYAFFPLNDGKTPLHMWLMVPFQFLFRDQLYAGRFLTVLVGLAQVFAIGYLTKILGGRLKTSWLAMFLASILPFWYFHHRMALIDGLFTFWLTMIVIGITKLMSTKVKDFKQNSPQTWIWIIFSGVSIGLAFWTKLPAILLLPALPFYIFLPQKGNVKTRFTLLVYIGISVLIGILLFLTLKLHPAFGQLFSRGGDFLYPISDVLFKGVWQTTIGNIPTYVLYFLSYLTTPVVLLTLYAPFSPTLKRQQLLLLLSAAAFAGPIMLFGLVVYPRYLFPASLFLTISAALAFQEIIDLWISKTNKLWQKTVIGLVVGLLAANTISRSGLFMVQALTSPDAIPFVPADQIQYLDEWSSGHGIHQTVTMLQKQSQGQTIAVATEGFFGTLPDGLLMYLHRQNVDNIYVEGIGQPVLEIPESFVTRAATYDQIWLIVNSHRMKIELPEKNHLAQFCRPGTAPCLDVWDITFLVK